MKKIIFTLLLSTFLILTFSQLYFNKDKIEKGNKTILEKSEIKGDIYSDNWAKKVLEKMTLEEKIAQLMMIRVYSNKDGKYEQDIIDEIAKFQPGGVCFFQGGPVRQINLTNRLQKVSKIPLLVAIDGEWGPSMRLDSCATFPYQMTIGALAQEDESLIYNMGEEIGKQCKALGIHINFAPCVDVNNNSQNPVINFRSFGENRENVARKAILYMQGMQEHGVSACAKHFPGHGDTKTDSHHALPVITKSYAELDSLEFYPFKEIIKAGVEMIMVSHLNIPALDTTPNSIATLSHGIITNILKEKLNFNGIIITDAMDMKGLRNSYPKGSKAEILALLAGVDILLLPNELKEVIPAIKEAVLNGIIPEELINEKCLKVLELKQKKHLKKYQEISTDNIYEKLSNEKSRQIIQEIEQKSLTLVKNNRLLLPLSEADNSQTAFLFLGDINDSIFYRSITETRDVSYFQLSSNYTKSEEGQLINSLDKFEKIVVFLLSKNQSSKKRYGISDKTIQFLDSFPLQKKSILASYANPYLLEQIENVNNFSAIFVGYKPTDFALLGGISALYDEFPFSGNLPVTINPFGMGTDQWVTQNKTELTIAKAPFSLLSLKTTDSIETIVQNAIDSQIFPGCQILVLQNGQTIFHKNFGRLKYEHSSKKVDNETLYDVASITKSVAVSLAIMKLYDEKKLKLNDKIGDYLPYLKGSNKAGVTIIELLTHTSGLPAYIPFYKSLCENGVCNEEFLQDGKDKEFSIEVAKNLYLHHSYIDTIQKTIATCKLGKKRYLYSDIGFVLLKEIVEEITALPFEDYVEKEFYRPLKLKRTLFNPLREFGKSDIAPTESDTLFRKQVVQGYAHDQTAALLGGVGGNAGLFTTANELAVLLQMLLNQGYYEGVQYISSETVKLFTSTHSIHGCNRRALGFDTPNFASPSSILPEKVGNKTFGHQGFTGTVFWCDPQNNIIYIFLSNRVYPDAEPNKLARSKIRLIIHQLIYEDYSF